MTEDTHPPTHEESLAYIIEKKVDRILSDTEEMGRRLQESNRTWERQFRKPDPLPTRRGVPLAVWLLLWALVAFASGSLYAASSGAQAGDVRVSACISALVEDVNPRLMAPVTARREARSVCLGMRRTHSSFFKALTQ